MTDTPSLLTPQLTATIIWVLMIGALAIERRLDFIVTELPTRPAQFLGGMLLAFVVIICVFLPIAEPPPDDPDISSLRFPDLFAAHFLIGFFLLCWWLLGGRRRLPEFLFLQTPTGNDWRAGLSLGALCWAGTMTVTAIAAFVLGVESDQPQNIDPPKLMLWMAGLELWQRALIVLAAMTLEEAFFRGFLQPRIGYAPSTVLFTLAHASYGMPLLMLGIGTFSIIVGAYFERTSRLLPCVLAHGVFDGIQLLVVLPYAAEMARKVAAT